MRAASSVQWVWKCPGHSGTMLSAVAVSARGGSNTTDTERLASLYIGPRQLPHYSRWPMANRIGRVPTLTLRGIPPNEGGRPFAWKSSSCGFDEPASPHENPPPIRTPPPPLASIIFVFYPLSRMIFRPYLSGRLEENSIRGEQVWKDWKLFSEWIYLLVWFWKIFREAEREIFGEIKLKKNLYKLNYHCR